MSKCLALKAAQPLCFPHEADPLSRPQLAMGDHPYKLAFGQDGSFMAMIEYATNKDTPQLGAGYSDECKEFANLCLAKDPAQRPPPDQMVNQNVPGDSHPWVVKWMDLSNEAVVEWISS